MLTFDFKLRDEDPEVHGNPKFVYTMWLIGNHKFPPTKINAYSTMDEGRWPKTSWKRGHLFSMLASSIRYCHPADGIFDTSICLSHAIYPSFFAKVAQ
jgi:hypothetical protein